MDLVFFKNENTCAAVRSRPFSPPRRVLLADLRWMELGWMAAVYGLDGIGLLLS